MAERGPIVPMNDLARAVSADADELRAAIDAVMRSGWFIHGEQHAAFESELAAYLDVEHVVGVANGTDALTAALMALGVGLGDRVCLTANAGFYASTACLALGAIPRYVDVCEPGLSMDPAQLAEHIDGASAVVVTHLYGGMAGVKAIAGICERHGVPLVEDCAQAIGASVGGEKAGTVGAIGCFSFYPTKNLGGLGDGGAAVTSDPDVAERLRLVRQYGWRSRYEVSSAGFNSRLDEMQAAVLRVRLARLPARNDRRREILCAYDAAARASGSNVRLVFDDSEGHAAHLGVLLSAERASLREHLRLHGIATDVHYPISDDQQSVWHQTGLSFEAGDLPITHRACSGVLSLPTFPELADAEVEAICDAIERFRGVT